MGHNRKRFNNARQETVRLFFLKNMKRTPERAFVLGKGEQFRRNSRSWPFLAKIDWRSTPAHSFGIH